MKFLIKSIAFLVIAAILAGAGLIGYLAITEYRVEPVLPVQISQQQSQVLDASEEIEITTFNIGYAALDKDVDFFMDGGTMSKGLSRERVEQNLAAIIDFLQSTNSDVYLLQEVDQDSSRSYRIDQRQQISRALKGYSASFGTNYQVAWVPVPLPNPMGRVSSGIQTLSRYNVHDATRIALPSESSWPTRLAHLKRCMLESRIPVNNGKELVIAHIHLSAFDQGGTIRNQQLMLLEEYAQAELAKGNYVLLGGDWNHLLAENPAEKRARLSAVWPDWLQILPDDFLPEFKWAFDENVPSNRSLDAPYDPNRSFLVTIDGFLVSPNIEIVGVYGHDLGFKFSDHNPVTLRIRLEQEDQVELESPGESELEETDAEV